MYDSDWRFITRQDRLIREGRRATAVYRAEGILRDSSASDADKRDAFLLISRAEREERHERWGK